VIVRGLEIIVALSELRTSRAANKLGHWLLQGHPTEMAGPHEEVGQHQSHPWWKVMCLTGVDYFSTLGYQPAIAALAAGFLAPIATLILVLFTLLGALPMYKGVAAASPYGDGSISMLERLLEWWKGKLFVLALIGFVATGFVVTITLSAADASAHIVENPITGFLHGYEVPVTLALIALLGAVFLKGFSEAIGIAVGLVGVFLLLNIVVIVDGFYLLVQNPDYLSNWRSALYREHSNPLAMVGAALLVFPALALGLSGFETGVLVMPQVKGNPDDTRAKPTGRIQNTRKLLTTAATIMSVLLIASSIIATTLIPMNEFQDGGQANGRALAYLAHTHLGNGFGTVYDVSTILILWFAGASAMAGLLNIVPRYLPRYGMAPDWARATRPLVLIFTVICFVVTIVFKASVENQAGAYATGVLAAITSASIAVTLAAWSKRQRLATAFFGAIAAIFIYTTLVTIIKEPEGIQIASIFVVAIIAVSLVSRVYRSTELRVEVVELGPLAQEIIDDVKQWGALHVIANHPDERDVIEYATKEREAREDNHIPESEPILFLEVTVCDASEFAPVLAVEAEEVGNYSVLRIESASIPNAIAAFLLHLRDITGQIPHIYFGWTEGNPLKYIARFILFGGGDIGPVTR
jgi:hypothetical protein